jgi:hypothetical protein
MPAINTKNNNWKQAKKFSTPGDRPTVVVTLRDLHADSLADQLEVVDISCFGDLESEQHQNRPSNSTMLAHRLVHEHASTVLVPGLPF